MISFHLSGNDLTMHATPEELRYAADKLEAAEAEAGELAQWSETALEIEDDVWGTVTFRPGRAI